MQTNKAYAYLSIDEFSCPVDEITKRIGLQPTKSWQAGEIVPPVPAPPKFNAWQLRSRIATSGQVERHVLDVLDQIRGREADLRDLAQKYVVRMQCVGYYKDYNPGFRLEPEIVRRLAECGMVVDLDAYYLINDAEEMEDVQDS
jgi:hypothetical protein